jgi:hypothetical protein
MLVHAPGGKADYLVLFTNGKYSTLSRDMREMIVEALTAKLQAEAAPNRRPPTPQSAPEGGRAY